MRVTTRAIEAIFDPREWDVEINQLQSGWEITTIDFNRIQLQKLRKLGLRIVEIQGIDNQCQITVEACK